MADGVTIDIPLALTVAQIARANPALSENEARELAQEMHSIIAMVQKLYAANPPDEVLLAERLPTADSSLPYETAIAYELGDLVCSVLDTIFGHWPADECEESIWLMVMLTKLDASDTLYARYLRVCDRVQGTDFASNLTMTDEKAGHL